MPYDLKPKTDGPTRVVDELGTGPDLDFVSAFDIASATVMLKHHHSEYQFDAPKGGYWVPKKDISRKPSMMIVAHTPPF